MKHSGYPLLLKAFLMWDVSPCLFIVLHIILSILFFRHQILLLGVGSVIGNSIPRYFGAPVSNILGYSLIYREIYFVFCVVFYRDIFTIEV